MSEFVTGNRFLSATEMRTNALYINRKLTASGWSKEAIAGMLGNMETESTINPGIWQNLTEESSNGFGLVQWTPSTKFTEWCSENGLAPSHMDSALARIEYEVENGLQWIPTDKYPESFEWFKTAKETPYDMAMRFLACYERPAEPNQPNRGAQAEFWYQVITNTAHENPNKKKNKMDLLMLLLITNRR